MKESIDRRKYHPLTIQVDGKGFLYVIIDEKKILLRVNAKVRDIVSRRLEHP